LKGENTFIDSGRRRWPVRNFLVAGQVAISVTLLVSAAVLAKSFSNTRTNDLGFGRKQLLLVWVSNQAATPSLYREVIADFEGMPGVRSVAGAVRAPLSLSSNGMFRRVRFPDRPQLAQSPPFEIKYNSVTANFFQTMGTPILRGRGFDAADDAGNLRSVLINERMAERFWPGEEAVGKTIRLATSDYSVIGVVRNAPINAVGEPPEPYLYLPYWANFEQEATFIVETTGDASALAQSARAVLKRVDTRLDPLGITTQNELIRYSAQPYQITAELVGGLGLLGLILTAVGLYGVVSYNASLRTRELGVRMALGASRNDALWLVLREVLMMGAIGVAIGLPLAMAATRLMTSLLFGVSPWDIPAFIVAIALLAVVIIVAAWIPAKRATKVPPSAALRVM
jgi:predicted permease